MLKQILALVFLMTLPGCRGVSSEPQQNLSAGELIDRYAASSSATRMNYEGRPIVVNGRVVEKPVTSGSAAEGLVVIGDPNETKDGIYLKCRFTAKYAEPFSRLLNGSYVVVEGVFSGERGAELQFCKLVHSEQHE